MTRKKPFDESVGRHLPQLALLAALLSGLCACSRDAARTPAPPDRDRAVSCLGRIEPENKVLRLAAPNFMGTRAIVTELKVAAGDTVTAGQALATLDTKDRNEAALQAAIARVAVAERRLAQIQAGAKPAELKAQEAEIARVAAALANAESEVTRHEQLLRNEVVTVSFVEKLRTEREVQARLLAAAKEKLASLGEVREVDVALANADISLAKAEVLRSRAEVDQSTIRAPVAGTILQIHTRPGEQVGEAGVLEMANTDRMFVIAEVFETDIIRVRNGSKARIFGGPISGELTGEVQFVASYIQRNKLLETDPAAANDSRIIEARILLDDPAAARLLLGAQVNVVIAAPGGGPP